VSTFTLLVGHLLAPDRERLVLELDAAGGDWAARLWGSLPEHGLVTLAASGRREITGPMLRDHSQVLGDGLRLLVAPPSAHQARQALDLIGSQLAEALVGISNVDVVADCGRLSPSSPVLPALYAADVVALVARPTTEEIAHLVPWVEQLRPGPFQLGLVLVGERSVRHPELHTSQSVADALGVRVWGVVADDTAAAGRLAECAGDLRRLARSRLVRSTLAVTEILAALPPRPVSRPARERHRAPASTNGHGGPNATEMTHGRPR
jgi:hypothetical protein